MKSHDQSDVTGGEKVRRLTEEEIAKVSGGMPKGKSSSYKCRKCDLSFPDAGTYFEHMRMVHGE